MNNNSYSFLRESENDAIIEINYDALIDLSKKDFSIDESTATENDHAIAFYCKDCKQLVEVMRVPSKGKKPKVQFCCAQCHGKKVFYGTHAGIERFFHIK